MSNRYSQNTIKRRTESTAVVLRYKDRSALVKATLHFRFSFPHLHFIFKIFDFLLHSGDEANALDISCESAVEIINFDLICGNADLFALQLLLHALNLTDVEAADVPHLPVELLLAVHSTLPSLPFFLQFHLQVSNSSFEIFIFSSELAHFIHQFDVCLQVFISLALPIKIVLVVFCSESRFAGRIHTAEILKHLLARRLSFGAGHFEVKLKKVHLCVAATPVLMDHSFLTIFHLVGQHSYDIDFAVHVTVLILLLSWHDFGVAEGFLKGFFSTAFDRFSSFITFPTFPGKDWRAQKRRHFYRVGVELNSDMLSIALKSF